MRSREASHNADISLASASHRSDIVETVDYERRLVRDLERLSLRLEHLTKIAGWAEAAGVNVTAVTGYLDEATVLLEVAGGSGSIAERHDAVHVARAWMTEASVALMAMEQERERRIRPPISVDNPRDGILAKR